MLYMRNTVEHGKPNGIYVSPRFEIALGSYAPSCQGFKVVFMFAVLPDKYPDGDVLDSSRKHQNLLFNDNRYRPLLVRMGLLKSMIVIRVAAGVVGVVDDGV